MARAGTAFIRVKADFTDVNRQVASYGRTLDRTTARSGGAFNAASKEQAKTLRQVGTAAKYAAGGMALVGGAAVVKSVQVAVNFEKAMRNVNSIAQLSEGRFKGLSQAVLSLAGKTAQAPETLAKGLYDLVSSGFDAKESLKILGASAKAATAGLTDTATSTKAVAAVLNAYRLPASKAKKVSDELFQTVNLGVITFEDLAQNIGDTLPFAASLGVGLDQVGSSISTMTKQGLSAAETMTRIRNLMQAVLKPSEGLKNAFKELGVASGEQLINQKGFQGALEALVGTTDGTKAAVAKLFPNIRALGGALALTGKNSKAAEKDLRGFKDTTGATDKVLAQQSKSLAYQWQKLKAEASALGISVGTTLLPVLKTATKDLGRFVDDLSGISRRKNLDFADRLRLSFKAFGKEFGPDLKKLDIGGKLAQAISFAIPVMAEAAAKAAPKAVRAFFDAWRGSNLWGKLIIGGFLLKKLGGFAAFRALGAKGGASFAQGFATTSAAGAAAGGVAAGAAGGRLAASRSSTTTTGTLGPAGRGAAGAAAGTGVAAGIAAQSKKIAPRVRAIGKGVLGLALVSGIADAVTSQDLGLGERIQRAASDITLGIVPDVKTVGQRLAAITQRIKSFRGQNLGLNTGNADTSIIRKKDLGDFTARQKRMLAGMAQLRTTANRYFGPGTHLLDKAFLDPRKAATDLDAIRTAFVRLKGGAITSLKDLRRTSDGAFGAIERTIGTHTKAGRQAAEKNFHATQQAIQTMVGRGEISVGQGMREIARLLTTLSAKGKTGVFKSFKELSPFIGRTMDKSGNLTRTGMDAIQLIMVNSLQNLGLSKSDIQMSLNKKASARKDFKSNKGRAGHGNTLSGAPQGGQRGGLIPDIVSGRRFANGGFTQFGKAGTSGPDNIPVQFGQEKIMVGSGEVGAVFNRHQLPVLNARLSDMGGLPGFFKRYDQKHSTAGGMVGRKRFAKGGIVALGRELQREGFAVGENPAFGGVHPVHAPHSYHYSGQAIDVNADNFPGGEKAALDKLYARLKHLRGVVELLWQVPNHFDHLHVAMTGGGKLAPGGGAVSMSAPDIPRQVVEGKGLVAQNVQAALDVGRQNVQRVLDRLAPQASGDLGEGVSLKGLGAGSAANRKLGKRMAAKYGWGRGPEWNALDDIWGRLEGSWDENLANYAGSGAYGIAQSLPASKYPPAGRPDAPPGIRKAQAQIQWGLNYIKGRYGDPIAAHAFRVANNYYAEGGLVEHFKNGGIAFGGGAKKPTPPYTDPKATRGLGPSVPGKKGPKKGQAPLKGSLAHALRQTLKRSKNKKAIDPFLKRLEKLGAPKKLLRKAHDLNAAHLKWADLATNADLLSTDNEDGSTTLGSLKGTNVVGYLTKDLDAQFKLRNQLVDIRDVVVKRRSQIERALKIAQARLTGLSKKAKTPKKWKGPNPATGKVDAWNKQPTGKRLKALSDWNKRGGKLPGDRQFGKNGTLIELKPGQKAALKTLVPKLTKQKGGLNTELHGTDGVLTQLQDLQGYGPKKRLRSPWPIGTIPGGSILQTQIDLRDRSAKPSITDSGGDSGGADTSGADSTQADLFRQLLQQANLRTAVSERGFDVLKNFPPYGGQFATGGVVPGPTGVARTVIAHGGERITPPSQTSGEPHVYIKFADGMGWLEKFVSVRVDRGTRRDATRGRRVMPGRAGSLTG